MKTWFTILLIGLLALPCMSETVLVDLHLSGDGKRAWAILQFSKVRKPSSVPAFFQYFDGVKGLYSISFLSTKSSQPLKRYAVTRENPFASHIILKKTRRKKGKEVRHFLSVVFLCKKAMNRERYPVSKSGSGILKLTLGNYTGQPFDWSLSQAGKNKLANPLKSGNGKNAAPAKNTDGGIGPGKSGNAQAEERLREKAAFKKLAEERKKREARQQALRAEEERIQEEREKETLRLKEEQEKIQKIKENQKNKEMMKISRLFEKKAVRYSSFGRRDPFIPLKDIPFKGDEVDIDQMKLVGIIWDERDPLAILEHRQETGISIAVRMGDKISNGKVSQITQSEVVFEISEYGVVRSYTMRLVSLEERMAK